MAADDLTMFGRFLERFSPEGAVGCSGEELLSFIEPLPVGLPDLLIRFAGASFGDGLYRLFEPREIEAWTDLAGQAFPALRDRLLCFGTNWLGYQFALDVSREEAGEPLTVMLDPAAGESVEIPATIVGFHEDVVLEYTDALLGRTMFERWLAEGNPTPPQGWCAGYRVPLFSGGEDDVANLELTEGRAYWGLMAQLREHATARPSEGSASDAKIA